MLRSKQHLGLPKLSLWEHFLKKNYITKTFIANALECGGFKILFLDQLNLFYFKTSDYSFSLPEISLPSSFGGIDKVMLIPFSKGRL